MPSPRKLRLVSLRITPGTLTDESLLDARTESFTAAVLRGRRDIGIAWIDLAGGRFERNEGISSKTGIWFWSVRLAHQGREDFTIGIDFQHTYGDELRDGDKLQMNVITIDMRYYY